MRPRHTILTCATLLKSRPAKAFCLFIGFFVVACGQEETKDPCTVFSPSPQTSSRTLPDDANGPFTRPGCEPAPAGIASEAANKGVVLYPMHSALTAHYQERSNAWAVQLLFDPPASISSLDFWNAASQLLGCPSEAREKLFLRGDMSPVLVFVLGPDHPPSEKLYFEAKVNGDALQEFYLSPGEPVRINLRNARAPNVSPVALACTLSGIRLDFELKILIHTDDEKGHPKGHGHHAPANVHVDVYIPERSFEGLGREIQTKLLAELTIIEHHLEAAHVIASARKWERASCLRADASFVGDFRAHPDPLGHLLSDSVAEWRKSVAMWDIVDVLGTRVPIDELRDDCLLDRHHLEVKARVAKLEELVLHVQTLNQLRSTCGTLQKNSGENAREHT